MSQNTLSDLTGGAQGSTLVTELTQFAAAYNSSDSGTSRPSYAVAGTRWLHTGSSAWAYNMFTGSVDVPMGVLDSTNSVFRVAVDRDGDSYIAATSTDDQIEIVTGGEQRALFSNSGLIVGASNGTETLRLLSSTPMQIPAGPTTNRPGAPVRGNFWINTEDNRVEYYDGTEWHKVAVISDGRGTVSGLDDTLITSPTTGQGLIWNGTNNRWENGAVDASVQDGSVTTTKLADKSVTREKLADNSVSTGQLVDGCVTSGKLDSQTVSEFVRDVAGAYIVQGDNITLTKNDSGNTLTISGVAGEVALGDGGVTTAKLANEAVTTAKIDDGAVTTAKVATGAIGSAALASNAVVAGKIAAGAVTGAKIASGAVGSAQIANGAVIAAKVASGAIGSTALGAGAVTAAKIASGAVGSAALASDAVTSAKIADDAVTSAKIADDAVGVAALNISAGSNITFSTANDMLTISAAGAQGGSTTLSGLSDVANSVSGAASGSLFVKGSNNWTSTTTIGTGAVAGLGEFVRDTTGSYLAQGDRITLTKNDSGDTLTISADAPPALVEGSGSTLGGIKSSNDISMSAGQGSLRPGVVASAELANDAVTSAKIADGAVHSVAIANGAVTAAKVASNSLTSTQIASGAIGNDELASDAVTAAKIADDAVVAASISGGAVGTSELAADAVTGAKIADDAVDTEHLADNSVGVAALNISAGANITFSTASDQLTISASQFTLGDGTVTTAKIADDAVTNAKIASNAVRSDSISAGAVDTSELAAGAVTAAKIAGSAVGSAAIASDAVTQAKIADNAVGKDQLAASAVSAGELSSGAVTSAKLATGAVGSAALASGAVVAAKIASGAVGSAALGSNAVTSAKIASSSVVTSKIANLSVTKSKLAGDSVGFGQLDTTNVSPNSGQFLQLIRGGGGNDTIQWADTPSTNVGDGTITAAKLASGAVTTAKIAANAVTSAKIADDAVTDAKIAASAVVTDAIKDSAVTLAKMTAGTSATSGQVLTVSTNGAVVAADAASGGGGGPTLMTERNFASSSAHSHTFTSIPSSACIVKLLFFDVAQNGTSQFRIRVGTSAGIVTTGYDAFRTTINLAGEDEDSSYIASRSNSNGNKIKGIIEFAKVSASQHQWIWNGSLYNDDVTTIFNGSIDLPGALDRIQTFVAVDVVDFNGGVLNCAYF